jgi:GNAT superfamily N-acetyltransferase
MPGVELRPARPDEAAHISELALRSKAYWGYSDEFVESCRAELTYRPEQTVSSRIVVAVVADVVVGFYALAGEPPVAELDGMFVDPDHIGTGAGGALFEHVLDAARRAGFTALQIGADPNAVGFYERHGAVRIGEEPSASIPGRMLPVLELDLTGG